MVAYKDILYWQMQLQRYIAVQNTSCGGVADQRCFVSVYRARALLTLPEILLPNRSGVTNLTAWPKLLTTSAETKVYPLKQHHLRSETISV